MMSGLDIQKRKISKSIQTHEDKHGVKKKYARYTLNLPREFVEKHDLSNLFLVADQVWFGLPDERSLMKVVALLPEIKELIGTKGLTKEDVKKILELNPEIRKYVMSEIGSAPEA